MKFVANAAAFANALSAVTRVVESRNTYPILANVHLTAEADKVVLRATDLDIEITRTLDANVEVGGVTTVPARTLEAIIKKMGKDWEVTVESAGENNVAVKAGRSRFSLATLSPDSFPDLKAGQFSHRFEMPAADLRLIIDKTSFAISTEQTRYYLNGIYFHVVGSPGAYVLRGVATDGHRMARCEVAVPDGAIGMPAAIVPSKTISEIGRLIEKIAGDVAVELSDTKLRIAVGDSVLLTKLIEGTYPDYDRVTPKSNNKHAIVSKTEIEKALDRVSTLATDRGGKAVKLGFADGLLKLEVTNSDHGSATEEMAVQFDPEEALEVGFNTKYLADILRVIDGADVRLELQDGGSPAVLRSDTGDGSFLAVLMPMRV